MNLFLREKVAIKATKFKLVLQLTFVKFVYLIKDSSITFGLINLDRFISLGLEKSSDSVISLLYSPNRNLYNYF